MKTITLKFEIGNKAYELGKIEWDRMGCDFEIKFSNRVYIEDVDVAQRGFYIYDAGEFCMTFDIIDNESGEMGNFYFDTDFMWSNSQSEFFLKPFDIAKINPIAEALKK